MPRQSAEQEVPETVPVSERERWARAQQVQSWALVLLAIATVLGACYVAKLVFIPLLVAILLAFILDPLVRVLQKIKVPRPIGAFLAILVVFAATYFLSYFFYNRAVAFAGELPRYSEKVREYAGRVREKTARLQRAAAGVVSGAPQSPPATSATVTVRQQPNWGGLLTSSLGPFLDLVLAATFIPFLTYFMLTWQEHTRSATVQLFSQENRNTAYVTVGRISAMIRGFLLGNFLMGLFMGAVSTAVFGCLGLPYFYFLGFISGFLSIIPYLGVVLAMLPPLAAGLGQISGGGFLAIVLTVLGLHLFALNVIYPKVLGSRLELNPLVVTIALLFWGWLWGAMGLILAVPITGAMKIIFDHIESLRPYGAWMGE